MKTILYVEDSDYNLLLVQAILGSRPDTQLLTAATATIGLDIARGQPLDLLLLDLNLPDMRGEEFLRLFRAIPNRQSVPVLVISGESMSDHSGLLERLGVADILFKPFDIDQFEKLVEGCLRNSPE